MSNALNRPWRSLQMAKAYTVDKHGNRHPVDWHDFMTNDDNPTLVRLTEELLNHPEYKKLFEEDNDDETD